MKRRDFLTLVGASIAWSPPFAQVTAIMPPPFAFDTQHSDPNRPTVSWGDSYNGTLIDTHAHLNPPSARRGNFPTDVSAAIASARTDRIVLLPAPNEGRFHNPLQVERLRLVQNSRGRVLRMCGSDYLTDWMDDAAHSNRPPSPNELASRLARLDTDLRSGSCIGVGEIGMFHFDTAGGQPVVRLPAAYPPFIAIARAAAAAGMPLDIHAEPFEPDKTTSHHAEIYGTLAVLFRDAPRLKLIYSHNGMTSARNARAMLEAFPDLMMNLRCFPRMPWNHLDPIVNEQRQLYADWAALLEEMSDRFIIGSDFLFGWDSDPIGDYTRLTDVTRRILGGLPRDVARKIGAENAERVFRL